jgi:hypothetical protein
MTRKIPYLGFQLRPENGVSRVYLIRRGDKGIPVASQQAVYADMSPSRAQAVADALNKGLLDEITRALKVST